MGRGPKSVSLPHFATDASVFTTLDYDNLGRIRFIHQPDGPAIETRCDGLTTYYFDAKQNERRKIADQSGRVVKSVEVTGATPTAPSRQIPMTYGYGPFSVLEKVTDTNGNVVTIEYDRLGRKLRMQDPDSGQRDYTYTAFGDRNTETINQNSPGAKVATYFYDNVGRLKEFDNRDGVTKWNWDTAFNGIGFLDKTTTPNGIATTNSFDNFGRLDRTTWTLNGQSFTVARDYDTLGRLKTLTYPAVSGQPAPFVVDFNYAAAGNLDSIVDHATRKSYYALLDTDAAGNPTNSSGQFPHEQFGNGLTTRRTEDPMHRGHLQRIETLDEKGVSVQRLDLHFDPNGNLDQREDKVVGSAEVFSYDASDRLLTWSWSSSGISRNVTFGYDDLGNFRSRAVIEDPSLNVTYAYDGTNGAGPHGITAMNGQKYSYDGRGELVAGPNLTIGYTAFELPASNKSPVGDVSFGYDADQQRLYKRDSNGDESITIGGLYEQRTHAGRVDYIFTIPGIEGPAAQVIWSRNAPVNALYLHADHLGSVDTISTADGKLGERLKYDPFGRRVQPTRLDLPVSASALGERNGFTGHEHDDDLGLINMKGRVYDPLLGRFLTCVRRYGRLAGIASGFVPGEKSRIVASRFARFARWRAIRFSRS